MAADTAFDALLGRMIELIDAKLTAAQRRKLALAMPLIQWDFPDAETTLCLAASAGGLAVSEPLDSPSFLVRMARTTLEDAAFGKRSIGAAFLAGKIHVRGMNPLRLREFIMLVDPLLESYREASSECSQGQSSVLS
jgi:hypothetical protein